MIQNVVSSVAWRYGTRTDKRAGRGAGGAIYGAVPGSEAEELPDWRSLYERERAEAAEARAKESRWAEVRARSDAPVNRDAGSCSLPPAPDPIRHDERRERNLFPSSTGSDNSGTALPALEPEGLQPTVLQD